MKEKYTSVVIEVSMEDSLLDQLKYLQNSPILKFADQVHFIHIYNDQSDTKFPVNIDSKSNSEVEKYISDKLKGLMDDLKPDDVKGEWFFKVLFHSDYKLHTLQFLKEVKADLVVLATRGEQGIQGMFKDSLSFYLAENSPCDVYILRPVH